MSTTLTAPQGQFVFPATEVVKYGPGALEALPDLVAAQGATRVFAVCSRHVAGLEERLHRLLGDRLAGTFTGTEMHVPRSSVLHAAAAAREARADLILSVGGGTQIDCASAVCLALACDIDTPDGFDAHRVRFTYPDELHVPAIDPDVLPHIAVPTTLSGAEATNIFGVTDPERQVKDAFVSPKFVPKATVYDAELTRDIPAWLWASSGMRAVDHAVEGVLSKRHMPLADALALEGLRLVLAELERSTDDPSDLHARTRCQLGAWLCIYGLTNVGVGLSHGLGHQLAAQFGMVHGVTSACMLPHVVALNSDVTGPQLARLDEVFGGSAVDGLRDFVRRLEPFGVPHTLEAAGAQYEELGEVADHTLTDLSVAVNPKPLTRDDLLGLLQAAWS